MKEISDNKEIDYTIVASSDSRKSATSAATRGIVGNVVGNVIPGIGPLMGTASGMMSAKNIQETTFTIVYKSGRREVKKVKNKSKDFIEYAKYLQS